MELKKRHSFPDIVGQGRVWSRVRCCIHDFGGSNKVGKGPNKLRYGVSMKEPKFGGQILNQLRRRGLVVS